jgi:nucleoside-diphosphate-sugar epimerase
MEAFEDGRITVDKLLDNIDLKLDWYVPSDFAIEFIIFIRLVLGEEPENTSPKAHYFFIDCVFQQSNVKPFFMARNIDFDFLSKNKWDGVYLCFGESRKYLSDITEYDKINYELSKKIIEILNERSEKIVVYSTCELWNRHSGGIEISDPFNFYQTPYLESKYKISRFVLENRSLKNTIVLYPFNFNSIYRTKDFLFGKIFDSIINISLFYLLIF